jgi:histidine ammonia-lyase
MAVEALLAAQAIYLRGLEPAPALRPLRSAIRDKVPMMVEDRVVGEDIAAVRAVLLAMAPGMRDSERSSAQG